MLAVATGALSGVPMPLSAGTLASLSAAVANGYGGGDLWRNVRSSYVSSDVLQNFECARRGRASAMRSQLYIATNGLGMWTSDDLGESGARMGSRAGMYSGYQIWALANDPQSEHSARRHEWRFIPPRSPADAMDAYAVAHGRAVQNYVACFFAAKSECHHGRHTIRRALSFGRSRVDVASARRDGPGNPL